MQDFSLKLSVYMNLTRNFYLNFKNLTGTNKYCHFHKQKKAKNDTENSNDDSVGIMQCIVSLYTAIVNAACLQNSLTELNNLYTYYTCLLVLELNTLPHIEAIECHTCI